MDTTKLKNRLEDKVRELDMPADAASRAKMELTPLGSNYMAFQSDALAALQENLKHHPLSFQFFDVVKSPSGGATVFSVPGLSGEEPEKELTGIILDYTTPRAYWDTPDPVEGTPPTCFSQDSVISTHGKACARCPYNDYGSKDGDTSAKACKESVLLFLLRPDNILPLLVRIPVTSKLRFLKYMARLIGTLTPINSVITRITLEKATNKTGKPYALYHFEAVGRLSQEEAASAREYAQQFMEIANTEEVLPEVG